MDPLNRGELKMLLKAHATPCVSAYLPTHRAFPQARQDPIRLKNLLREAEGRLRSGGLSPAEAQELLRPATALVDDSLFWKSPAGGLALFARRDRFHRYRLPVHLDELLVVTDRFHTKPLLPLFEEGGRFHLLALGRGAARLYECTRHGWWQLELSDLQGRETDEPPQRGHEPQVRPHVGAPAPGERRAAIYHGLGSDKGDAREELLKFCRIVDHQVCAAAGGGNVPLVLACLDHLAHVYRTASHHHRLLDEHVAVNPDDEGEEDLHRRAWAIAGRVGTLFVAVGVQRWSSYDPRSGGVQQHATAAPGDEDLLDVAAAHAWANGAVVHAMEPDRMPSEAPIAAVYRY